MPPTPLSRWLQGYEQHLVVVDHNRAGSVVSEKARHLAQTTQVIRLVATDLDGTFWDRDLVVPPAHVEAIEELARRGVTVLAATSRRPRVVRASFDEAALVVPAVLLDGAIGIDFRSGDVFHQVVFDPVEAAATLDAFRRSGLEPCVYVDDVDVDIVLSGSPSTCPAHVEYLRPVSRVGSLDEAVARLPVYAFSVLGLARSRLEPVAGLLRGQGVELVFYPEPSYGEYGLIANPPGVSKWSGVDAFCRVHGISATEVLAVGDADNDLTMLTHAGVAVGVEGGTEGVLALADHVIAAPAKNGWATLLDLIP